jgi:hypothetical protein
MEISKKEVFEKLSISGLGKSDDKLIFERRGINIIAQSMQNENAVKQLLSMNPESSLLPLNLKFPVLAKPYRNCCLTKQDKAVIIKK